ncbi:MAG: hypothetical protein ACJAWV_003603 [Flammeovirgaceae bacterium]|jgi:cytochrome c oxidase cbb3-type subunit 4
MYKDVLRSIAEVEMFPIVGILIFMGFFLIISIYALRLSKAEVGELENLPFQQETEKTEEESKRG